MEYTSSSSQIPALVAAGGTLYFLDTTTSSIKDVAEGGGTATTYTTASAGTNFASSLAADSTNLYYATTTAVEYSALGATGSPLPSMSGLTNVVAIALDASNVYAIDQTGGFVASCPLAHNCGTSFTKVATGLGLSTPRALFSDGTNLWIAGFGGVLKCSTAGCGATPTTWVTGGSCTSVVADCTNVYWTDASNSVVASCPVSGTGCGANPTVLATATAPGGLAQNATSLYYCAGQVYELTK
jgi:hypothetical protein